MTRRVSALLLWMGDVAVFAMLVLREAFRAPREGAEIARQIFEVGWRSLPLIASAGFAVGAVLSMHTRASLERFGAEALIPAGLALALFKETGPLVTGLLVAGRVGAGIGAELGAMRVTEQIDALESLAVDSFKYLVVTRVAACVLVLPLLTTIMNFTGIKPLAPGQVVFVDRNRNVHARRLVGGHHTPCLFEWVYFARPDSFIDGANVYKVRVNLGRFLAAEIRKRKLPVDVVVPVPDSARDAAIEIARKLNLKYSEALVKNRYIGRTFIMPADDKRKSSIRQKLNPIASEVKGKRVLLVDDSIVRGNTSRAIIEMIRDCGAKKVYLASYSPPLRHPCVYGIDMQTANEFVARDADEKAVAKKIGADKVIYQSLDALKKAVSLENPKLNQFCAACFDGVYPTGDVSPELLKEIEESRNSVHENQLELNI